MVAFSGEILLVISILSILYLIWIVSHKRDGTILDKFTDKFSIMGSVFVPVGIFLTYRVFSLQLQSMQREATFQILDRGWLGVNEKLIKYHEDCPKFVDSLYFDWQKKVLGSTKYEYDANSEDKWYAVNYLSILIFQAWEDFLTASDIDQTGSIVWLNNFLQWSSSPMLRNNWSVLRSNFADTTQQFGDYLFYVSATYNPKNEGELHNLAAMVYESDTFKGILRQRHAHL